MYKVSLYTLGCKVSSYETEAVAEEFARRGFAIGSFGEVCDVYVINTCTVTAESDAKSRKYIRRAIRLNPQAVVLVMGCYSQRSPDEVAAIEGVDAVVGTADKMTLVPIAERLLSERENSKIRNTGGGYSQKNTPIVSVGELADTPFEQMRIERAPRTRGYVKIEDGCECKCTYCAIAAARGPVRSKLPCDVIDEVKGLYASGTREIVLTGIETGSYGADFDNGYTLAALLSELDSQHACDRIRLGSMAPELIGEKFISRVGRLKILVPHFHVSMQSGSDSILREMKRRYTRARALENLRRIREYMPGVMFTADLMVGFPGETEEDFRDTVSFVREAGLLDAHVFAYSRREGTPAAARADQVAEDVKRERSARLIAVKNQVRDEALFGLVRAGAPLSVVFETRRGKVYSGHSDSYVEVVCESETDLRGEIRNVIPLSHKDGIVFGKLI